METSITKHHQNVATFIHLSTFSQYFIPFGNFIIPLVLWTAQKKESRFVDNHGRQALNFQISILIYAFILFALAVPFIVWQAFQVAALNNGHYDIDHHFDHLSSFADISGLVIICIAFVILLVGLFVFELIAVISAAVSANRGQPYKYPLTINFIKESKQMPHAHATA